MIVLDEQLLGYGLRAAMAHGYTILFHKVGARS